MKDERKWKTVPNLWASWGSETGDHDGWHNLLIWLWFLATAAKTHHGQIPSFFLYGKSAETRTLNFGP